VSWASLSVRACSVRCCQPALILLLQAVLNVTLFVREASALDGSLRQSRLGAVELDVSTLLDKPPQGGRQNASFEGRWFSIRGALASTARAEVAHHYCVCYLAKPSHDGRNRTRQGLRFTALRICYACGLFAGRIAYEIRIQG
jgi:hypothetical protein